MADTRTQSLKSSGKYLGLGLLIAWHYSFWFVPNVFPNTHLLGHEVTLAWLTHLISSALTLFLIPPLLGRKTRLSSFKFLFVALPAVLSFLSMAITVIPAVLSTPLIFILISILIGICNAGIWMLWGELYAKSKANFSINHIGPAVGVMLLASLIVAFTLPAPFASLFVALLPLISGFLLCRASKGALQKSFPALQPPSGTIKNSHKSIGIVCFISLLAGLACYYLIAIIPWEEMPGEDDAFAYGAMCGAMLMFIITAICIASRKRYNIFKLFPWLIVLIIIAFAIYVADEFLYFYAFLFTIAITSVFELLLAMYFGVLMSKGYITPLLAFGLSGGCVRSGMAAGNIMAITYEMHPNITTPFLPETALLFICLLAILLISLVRQEYTIAKLTSDPADESEIDKRCCAIAQEFRLSARETDILKLLARGYTTNGIAKKLVISPHTVNTHIRHAYEKTGIHKRSELIDFVNINRSDPF